MCSVLQEPQHQPAPAAILRKAQTPPVSPHLQHSFGAVGSFGLQEDTRLVDDHQHMQRLAKVSVRADVQASPRAIQLQC